MPPVPPPLTLPIREVLPATPRSRIVRVDLRRRVFDYLAGQAVLIASHQYEKRRPYSIACAPEDARDSDCLELLIGVDASGSPGPHLTLEAGALIDIEGPVGRFVFPAAPVEQRFLFVAGGTGIAPLRAMMRHAVRLPGRSISLLYSARAPGDFAYEDEMQGLMRAGRISLRQTVTRDLSAEGWTGTRGRIGSTDLAALVHDPETLCFVCGPQALVQDIPRLLEIAGVLKSRIRIEEW